MVFLFVVGLFLSNIQLNLTFDLLSSFLRNLPFSSSPITDVKVVSQPADDKCEATIAAPPT